MKTTKKILGVALAVIMLCNVFAVASFAAPAEGGAVKLMLETDKTAYAPGDNITFTVSEQVLAAVGAMQASGQYEFGYNSTILQPLNSDNKIAEKDSPVFTDLAGDAAIANCRIIFNDACIANGSMILDSDATAYGWDKIICVSYMHTNGTEFDATTAPLKLFTFTMKIADNAAAGTYTFGFNQGGYESYTGYSNDCVNFGVYGYTDDYGYGAPTNYDCGVVTFTVEGSSSGDSGDKPEDPTPTAPVSTDGVQVKWKDKANNQIFIGFCGVYTGTVTTTKDPVTGKEIVNEIYEIGFRMSTSDESLATATDVPAETLYDFGSGTYKFRAVTESTTDSTLPLYGKAYIQLTKDSDKLLSSDDIKTTVAAEYKEATEMEGFNA